MKFVRSFFPRLLHSRRLHALLLILLGTTIGLGSVRFNSFAGSMAFHDATLGTRLKPGPWGELYAIPFNISAPEELLPIRTLEADGVHWVFKNYTLSELTHFFDSMEMPDGLQHALLEPAAVHLTGAGIELTPTPQTVVALLPKTRREIYRLLARFPENKAMFTVLHKSTIDERFEGSGIATETLALFHALCFEHGDYLFLGDLSAVLSQLPSYEEKVRFLKAIISQKTMLLQLHVTKDSDLSGLVAYWGRGCRAANTRSLLEAVQAIPGGTVMNLMTVLPPRPVSHLNRYPVLPPTCESGPVPVQDCHWTSLNFFRETEEENSVNPAAFYQEITKHYFVVTDDPRYGDILVFTTSAGDIVHSAVFIADDIVFTKNGAANVYPWIFAAIPDLLNQYSYLAPDGQQLLLHYFRSKEM